MFSVFVKALIMVALAKQVLGVLKSWEVLNNGMIFRDSRFETLDKQIDGGANVKTTYVYQFARCQGTNKGTAITVSTVESEEHEKTVTFLFACIILLDSLDSNEQTRFDNVQVYEKFGGPYEIPSEISNGIVMSIAENIDKQWEDLGYPDLVSKPNILFPKGIEGPLVPERPIVIVFNITSKHFTVREKTKPTTTTTDTQPQNETTATQPPTRTDKPVLETQPPLAATPNHAVEEDQLQHRKRSARTFFPKELDALKGFSTQTTPTTTM